MNKKFIYGLIAGIVFFLGWWLVKQPQPATTAPQPTASVIDELKQSNRVAVAIDFGDGQEVKSEVAAVTAFAALEAAALNNNLKVQTKVYDFGTLVEKIGAQENLPDKAWIYFVNGESGQVAADQMQIRPGDLVEWKYMTPN